MNHELQATFLTKCLLNAVAAADASYSVSITAAFNAAMILITTSTNHDRASAWTILDACVAAMEMGLTDQCGPRPDPSMS